MHSKRSVTESKMILMHSYAFVTYSGFGRAKTRKGNREEGNEGTRLSNYTAICKCTNSRSGKAMADSEELSVTACPLAGGDDDNFIQAAFSSPRVRRNPSPTF